MKLRSKKTWLWTAVGISIGTALLGAGCKTKSNNGDGARVRLINAVPSADGLTVSVSGDRAWKNAAFRSSSGYQTIAAGTYPVQMSAARLGTAPAQSLSFEKGRTYTVLALGRAGGGKAQLEVLNDPTTPPASGRAGVCLINASLDGKPLDLVINSIVAAKSVPYGGRSTTLALDGGTYDLQVAAADTPNILAGPVSLRLEPGHTYTLAAIGNPDDGTLSLEAYPDAR